MRTGAAASEPGSSISEIKLEAWRTPAAIVLCGCLIGLLTFGPRSAAGQFVIPLSMANSWDRNVFSAAFAIQNLLWGVGQPFAGAVADRFGTVRVLCAGGLMYALGLGFMAFAQTPLVLGLSAGVLIGFGLAGASFNLVLSAFGKLVPQKWRALSLGAGTAAGSFGQFLFSPLAAALIRALGWQQTLLVFAGLMLLVLPLSLSLATPKAAREPGTAAPQSLKQALTEAFAHRSYVLLVLGFFTCGFQLNFITVHLPAYLVDRGLPVETGAWTIAIIGLFNIFGSLSAGWLSARMPMRYLLAAIYFIRALAVLAFIALPMSTASALIFGAVMGATWLSTVPPTASLVTLMFGSRWAGMLYGFAFFSHQVGGFLGVLLGGFAITYAGSYDPIWWLSILFGVLSALINLPIVEKPVARMATLPA